jgi:hypothetical protein
MNHKEKSFNMSYVVFTNNFLSKTAGEAPIFLFIKEKNYKMYVD